MPTAIIPVPKFTNATPDRPAVGELAGMETGPAPMGPLFQVVFDRLQYVRGITWGQLIGGDEFGVDPGGTSTLFAARLSPFEAVGIQDTASVFWPIYNTAETVFTQADITGNVLPNDAFVYAYLGTSAAGALTRELSTTAPNASKVWKSTELNRKRLVGCLRTTSTGVPLPMVTVDGRALYHASAIAAPEADFPGGGLRALDRVGAQAALTDLGLSARVPPHARLAILDIEAIGDNAAPATLTVYSGTDTVATKINAAYTINAAPVRQRVEVPVGAGAVVKYTLSGGAVVNGRVFVVGWR